MNDIHHKIDHFWLFTDCRWKLFDGRSARSTAPLIGAGKINQELLAAWLLWAEGERRLAIFAYFLTTSLQIWGRLSEAHESIWPADWDWDGDGEEKITVNIYLELNLLPSSSILNHSTCWRNGSFQKALCVSCKCPVCSQFIFPIAACQLRCELQGVSK